MTFRPYLVMAACVAVLVYVWGLGGLYIPSNGDEMVYAHIARKTAESGHWLPLASDLFETRNTKPPMLFWQAMVAGEWGGWHLAALRTPGLIYTFAIAAALAWLLARAGVATGTHSLLASVAFLAFFSTLRYHRAYLTSAPETFWFSLPILVWLAHISHIKHQQVAMLSIASKIPDGLSHRVGARTPSWISVVLLGLGLGLGLAYKSFALIAPAVAAWWCVVLVSQPWMGWRSLGVLTLKLGVAALLALCVFGLWFVLDPDPAAVWQEFIVAENAKKFSDQRGYWAEALGLNGSSIWSQLLAYAVNAGLLAPLVLGLMVLGWQRRGAWREWLQAWRGGRDWNPAVVLALAWLGVWLLTFIAPSQRSARYVIPAMPAVAILLAIYWQQIGAWWFRLCAVGVALAVLMLARVAWVMHSLGISSPWQIVLTLTVAAATLCAALHALLGSMSTDQKPTTTEANNTDSAGKAGPTGSMPRLSALMSVLGVYALMSAVLMPLDQTHARFAEPVTVHPGPSSPGVQPPNQPDHPQNVAVPNNFNGQYERYRYILPEGWSPLPYDVGARAAQGQAGLMYLLAQHDAVVWMGAAQDDTPACAPSCRVLGVRWVLKSRHLSGEVRPDNLWQPQDWLLAKEWWVSARAQ